MSPMLRIFASTSNAFPKSNLCPHYIIMIQTVCPRSYPFYIVTYYINWVTTSWTYSMNRYIEFEKRTLTSKTRYMLKGTVLSLFVSYVVLFLVDPAT